VEWAKFWGGRGANPPPPPRLGPPGWGPPPPPPFGSTHPRSYLRYKECQQLRPASAALVQGAPKRSSQWATAHRRRHECNQRVDVRRTSCIPPTATAVAANHRQSGKSCQKLGRTSLMQHDECAGRLLRSPLRNVVGS